MKKAILFLTIFAFFAAPVMSADKTQSKSIRISAKATLFHVSGRVGNLRSGWIELRNGDRVTWVREASIVKGFQVRPDRLVIAQMSMNDLQESAKFGMTLRHPAGKK